MSSSTMKTFSPPNTGWQDSTAKYLKLHVKDYLKYGRPKQYNCHSAPKATHDIRADGNCFFRALSVLITGVEDNHMTIREEITRHVERHADIYRTFLQSRGGMDTYVRSMRRPREWATDTEIFAAATFLKTIIEVCSIVRNKYGTEYQWQTFTPLNDDNALLPKVYICHKDDHFEPILDISETSKEHALNGSVRDTSRTADVVSRNSQSQAGSSSHRSDRDPGSHRNERDLRSDPDYHSGLTREHPAPRPLESRPSNPHMASSYSNSFRDPRLVQTETRGLGMNQRRVDNLRF